MKLSRWKNRDLSADRLKLEPSGLIPEDPASAMGMSETKRGMEKRINQAGEEQSQSQGQAE